MRAPMQGTKLADGRWRVVVVLTGSTGKKIRKGFERKTQKEAQAAALKFLRENGREAPDDNLGGTVRAVVEAVKADLWGHLEQHTRDNYASYAARLVEEFGDRRVEDVTAPQLTNYMKRYAQKTKRTMDEHWKVARAVFGYAASDLGWITRSPMEDARKPKSQGKAKDWPPLTREQFNKILAKLGEPYHLFYRLLGETGARPSEAWGLNTEDRLEFIQDVWWFVVRRGKTEASTRRVPIPDSLARDLSKAGPTPFAHIASFRQPSKHLLDNWKKAMKEAGLPYTRPYEVRAMRINEWRKLAVPGLVRTKMVGHTSEKTTAEWYDHVDAAEVLKALGVGSSVGDDSADAEE